MVGDNVLRCLLLLGLFWPELEGLSEKNWSVPETGTAAIIERTRTMSHQYFLGADIDHGD